MTNKTPGLPVFIFNDVPVRRKKDLERVKLLLVKTIHNNNRQSYTNETLLSHVTEISSILKDDLFYFAMFFFLESG